MSARRLEEILEECLSAYLDGRRSIEESLSLYPSDAARLEPLLRTAIGVNYAVSSYSPPAHITQRGLHRFLSDARVRRNLKTLRVDSVEPGRVAVMWQKFRLGFAGAAMAVLVLGASIGGTALIGGGGTESSVFNPSDTATPPVVIELRQKVDDLSSRRATHQLTPGDIELFIASMLGIESAPDSEIETSRASIGDALNDANQQLSEIIATQDPILTQPAQQAQERIRDVAAGIGVLIGTPTVVATTPAQTTAPTPTAAATVQPTPTAAPTQDPTPVVQPTQEPTLPAATEEPPPRAPAAFAN